LIAVFSGVSCANLRTISAMQRFAIAYLPEESRRMSNRLLQSIP
jgi:hypothetical protein